MAFTGNYSCNTLRSGLANGTINLSTDTFRLALYTNAATLDQTTTAYTTTGEASGGNYSAGGQVVTATVNSSVTPAGSVVYVTFTSPSWTGTITARGALIYKAGDNGAVCVLDFGNDKISSNTFTVTMPADTSTSALIRIT
jgi:3D (Asp-Asp-Asp) domain-containing protein